MKITRIYVNSFGILRDLDIEIPKEGIAMFYGPNESGKTTLMEFVKFIIAGPKRKTRYKDISYQPQDGGKFGGHLEVVTSSGEAYIIERYITTTSKAEGNLIVKAKDSLKQDKELKDLMGEISLKFYDSIFALGLNDVSDISSLDRDEVKTKALNASEGISADTLNVAYSKLKNTMGELYKPSGVKPDVNVILSKLNRLEKKIVDLQSGQYFGESSEHDLDRLKRNFEEKAQNLFEIQRGLEWLNKLIDDIFSKFLDDKRLGIGKKVNFQILAVVFSIVILAMTFLKYINFWLGISITLPLLIFCIVDFIRVIKVKKRKKMEKEKYLEGAIAVASSLDINIFNSNKDPGIGDIEYLKSVKDKLDEAKNYVSNEMNSIQREIDILSAKKESLSKENEIMFLLQEMESTKALLVNKLKDWAVAAICFDSLKKVQKTQDSRIMPEVFARASKMLSEMTDSKYKEILENGNFERTLVVDRKRKDFTSEELSTGTREQLYLALRIALIEQYNKGFEPLPILLDDVFVNYDHKRSQSAVNLISEMSKENQIFVFTCHNLIVEHFRATGNVAMEFNMVSDIV